MRAILIVCQLIFIALPVSAQTQFSTGGVRDYIPNGCAGPDLPATIPEVRNFQTWYVMGGFRLFSAWENGDVFGSDFRDAGNGDTEVNGGSDVPQIYLFAGHGICQNPPIATSSDNITSCGNFGKPDNTVVGSSSRWGNGAGNLRFAFIDASCPMDLVSLGNQWFPAFRGLHIATGHSGTTTMDALDSDVRGTELGARTAGLPGLLGSILPHQSVGDAWMSVGTKDIQSGACAVVIAAGNNQSDAIDRRENERVKDNRPDPTPNWFAWRWLCR